MARSKICAEALNPSTNLGGDFFCTKKLSQMLANSTWRGYCSREKEMNTYGNSARGNSTFMNRLGTTAKTDTSSIDEAVRYATKFNSLTDLKTQFLSDIRTANDLFILKALPHGLEASLALIEESFGFALGGMACDVINIKLDYDIAASSHWLSSGNATLNAPCYAGSYTLLRYMANGVTVVSRAGDDTIYNNDYVSKISVNSSDGNDVINGFNESSTLQIGGGNITLQGAASLSAVNIIAENTLTLTDSSAAQVSDLSATTNKPTP